MNFPIISNAPCISTAPLPPDPRCTDPAFALANPAICSSTRVLVIKPGTAVVCVLGSIQFRVFVDQNGVETEVTSQCEFMTSDPTKALVGAISGNATGVGAGQVTITALYQGTSASAHMSIMPGTHCCDTNEVDTVLLLDVSKSMSLAFGDEFATKGNFAAAVAAQYASQLNTQKDKVALITFDSEPTTVDALTGNGAQVATDAASELPTTNQTGIGLALQAASTLLSASSAPFKVIVLISDGEDKDTVSADDPLQIAATFKDSGGIIICCGVRAHDTGFNLLNAISTGGFFVNAYPPITDAAIANLMGLKGFICAGNCIPQGDVVEPTPSMHYTGFLNWNIAFGSVNLFGPGLFDLLPGHGLYVDLSAGVAGGIVTKNSFTFTAGKTYRVSVDIAGNQRMNLSGYKVRLQLGDGTQFQQDIAITDFEQPFQTFAFNFTPMVTFTGALLIRQLIDNPSPTIFGSLIDNVVITDVTDQITMFSDNFDNENLIYIPPRCGPSTLLTFVPLPPSYDGGGICFVTGLVPGLTYNWNPGPNDNQIDGGSFTLQHAGTFVPTFTTAQLNGAANGSVTATITTLTHPGYYGYACYGTGCLNEAIGVQQQDPNPLPDIEGGYTPPTIYLGNQTFTAKCPPGDLELDSSLIPVMTSATTPSGTVTEDGTNPTPNDVWQVFGGIGADDIEGTVSYIFASPQARIAAIGITPKPSAIGKSYVFSVYSGIPGSGGTQILPPQFGTFANSNRLVFNLSTVALNVSNLFFNLNIGNAFPMSMLLLEAFSDIPGNGVTRSATATSIVSQADADAKALLAAQLAATAALVCEHQYTSTQSYTANCPVGEFGAPVTRSATKTSLVSQADADAQALAAAMAAATAALDCTGSNNTSAINIPTTITNTPFPSSPYPSVQFVSGVSSPISRVRVNLIGIQHDSEEDLLLVLQSPSGKKICLMFFCGGIHSFGPFNVTFDSNSATVIPQSSVWSAGSFKPTQYGTVSALAAPGPGLPYAVDFSSLIGDSANGSWALWINDCKNLDSGSISGGWNIQIN